MYCEGHKTAGGPFMHGYEAIGGNYLVTRFTGGFDLRDLGISVQNDNRVPHMEKRLLCYTCYMLHLKTYQSLQNSFSSSVVMPK